MKDALNEDNALIEAGPDAPAVAPSYCAADDTAGRRRRPGFIGIGVARGHGVRVGRALSGGGNVFVKTF
jgi:hypothetical protein